MVGRVELRRELSASFPEVPEVCLPRLWEILTHECQPTRLATPRATSLRGSEDGPLRKNNGRRRSAELMLPEWIIRPL